MINVPTRLETEKEDIKADNPPLNYACLIGMIHDDVFFHKKHNLIFMDAYLNAWDVNALTKNLIKYTHNIDLIAIGGISTIFGYVEELLPHLRSLFPKAKILLGGQLITSYPAKIVELLEPDIAIVGEGEIPFKQTCDSDLSDERLVGIPNLIWKNTKGVYIINPTTPPPNLEELPSPSWDLINVEQYAINSKQKFGKKVVYSHSSRGCPHNCIFCTYEGRPEYRSRSVFMIFNEIERLLFRTGANYVQFFDENFTYDKNKIQKFCDEYDHRGCNFTWGFLSRVDQVSLDMFEEMYEHGARRVGFGIESGNKRILGKLRKGTIPEQAYRAVTIARASGIEPYGTFIFGSPTETKESMWDTVEMCKALMLPNRPFILNAYIGTDLFFEYDIEHKVGDFREYLRGLGNATSLTYNFTDMTDEVLLSLRDKAIEEMKDYYWTHLPLRKKLPLRLQQLWKLITQKIRGLKQ